MTFIQGSNPSVSFPSALSAEGVIATPHPDAIAAILNRFTHFGVELGLERIERLLNALGNPQRQVPIIHVAGSNGKGSVCAYLSAVLKQAGYQVGRYISPHLVDWTERICINDVAIAPQTLQTLLTEVVSAIDPSHPSPTQFEVITAASWLHFARQRVDVAVIEVGLGGRLDATNVCDRPLVSVITSLSREHWQRLGPTLADITREKAGILKPGCPAAIAPQPAEATAVLKQRLRELGCPVVWVEPAKAQGEGWAELPAQTVEWGSQPGGELLEAYTPPAPLPPCISPLKYPLPLPGAHQLINSAVAIAALRLLQMQGWAIEDRAIAEGMGQAQWPGRLQWTLWHNRPLLIDGAHNPAGAMTLRQYVDTSDRVTRPVHWVMGMIGTKDHADVLRELLRQGDRLSLVPVPDHLPVDLEYLAQLAREVCPDLAACQTFSDVIAALSAAVAASPATQSIVLCGSLYLIGHFFKLSHCLKQHQ